jgi:hypothetical protein
LELNVRLLAKTAKALEMPIVLSTVGVGGRSQVAHRTADEGEGG